MRNCESEVIFGNFSSIEILLKMKGKISRFSNISVWDKEKSIIFLLNSSATVTACKYMISYICIQFNFCCYILHMIFIKVNFNTFASFLWSKCKYLRGFNNINSFTTLCLVDLHFYLYWIYITHKRLNFMSFLLDL